MTAPTRYSNYGLDIVNFWRVGSTGIAHGQLDPAATLTPNTTSHALAFYNDVITAGLPDVQRKRATFAGQNFIGGAYFGISDVPEFDIELANFDTRLLSMSVGGNQDVTTILNALITSLNFNNPIPNDMGLSFSHAIQSRDSGTDGTTAYETWVFPRVNIQVRRPNGATASDGENTQSVTVTVQPSMATKHPWGAAFGSNEGFAGNKNIGYIISGDRPYGLTAWVANGSATTFVTEFTPYSSGVTSGKTNNVFSINGTVTAPTSISTSTGTVTVAAAGTTDDRHVAFYQIATPITPL